MRILRRSRPFVAVLRGVPVLVALFLGVTANGEPVRGMAAQYPDGTQAVAVLPGGER